MAENTKDKAAQPALKTVKVHSTTLTVINFTYEGKEYSISRDGNDYDLPAESDYVQSLIAQGTLVESK